MLCPGEIDGGGGTWASLFCAVTSIRCAPVDAIQNDAKRYSFSRSFRSTLTISHACGAGESKQLLLKKRVCLYIAAL